MELKNINKTYKNNIVLKDISFTLKKGETAVLTGQSGAGKSTLLKIISGIVKPDTGYIRVNRNELSYIFQEPRLIPWINILENLVLPIRACGKTRKDAEKTARKFLSMVELEKFENNYPKELSGGMKQRVSIARSLCVKPGLILMDEPFTGLDQKLKEKMKSLISEYLTKANCSAFVVTHNLDEVFTKPAGVLTLKDNTLIRR